MKSVLIVDDRPLTLYAISGLLRADNPELNVYASASLADVPALLAKAGETRPVVFLNIRMQGGRGMQVLEDLCRQDALVVAIASDACTRTARQCAQLGAAGLIEDSASVETYTIVTKLIFSGGSYFPLELRRPGNDAATKEASSTLTARQLDVLNLVSAGRPNKVIAVTLELTEGTVKNYVSSLLRHYGVNSRAQLILRLRDDVHGAPAQRHYLDRTGYESGYAIRSNDEVRP